MHTPTLVVMAAGLGSRYGGLKQIAPVDNAGHILIDYAIYDALRAGFSRVVCVIKPEMEADFREAIGERIAPFVDIAYAFQRLDTLPKGFAVPPGRQKPWGTAHAVLCARAQIPGAFAVINADDFYGRSAIAAVHDFLCAPHRPRAHALAGYRLANTLSESGHVARGVCEVQNGCLTGITERTHIEPRPGGAAYTEDGTHFTFLPGDITVSMNLWGYRHSFLADIEAHFAAFLEANLPTNPLKCEYYLPYVADALLAEGAASFAVLPTDAKWYGVTYREDMPGVRAAIARMRAEGLYPDTLWGRA